MAATDHDLVLVAVARAGNRRAPEVATRGR